MVSEKRCTKCGEMKALEAFAKNRSNRDGMHSHCKECTAAYRRANRHKANAYFAEYRAANAQRIRNTKAEWYRANEDKVKAAVSDWKAANKDSVYASIAKRRARMASVPHEPYSRADIFSAYGGTCAYCDAPAEHVDHVVPISKGGPDVPHNLLPACAPCNLGKSDKSLAEWAATF